MSRREILQDTLARLEAERYAPLPPRPRRAYHCEPLTPEQQAENRRILADAIGDDPHVWDQGGPT